MAQLTIIGIEELITSLESLATAMEQGEVLEAAGTEWLERTYLPQAKAAARVDTGEWRDSIEGEVQGGSIHIWSDAEHASIMEYGSSTFQGDGTLTHTLETTADALVTAINNEIQRRLK